MKQPQGLSGALQILKELEDTVTIGNLKIYNFKTAGKRKKLYKKENVIINHSIALKYIPIVIIM